MIDLWPRDNESSCSADMTRTFVVGEIPDEVAEWHRLCREALDARVARRSGPGVTGKSLFDAVCDIFEAAGYPTQRTKAEGEPLEDGFFHSLGHGVGLEVHEQPMLGITGHDDARRGRRARGRAGPLPRRLRRLPARGPRARHRRTAPRP